MVCVNATTQLEFFCKNWDLDSILVSSIQFQFMLVFVWLAQNVSKYGEVIVEKKLNLIFTKFFSSQNFQDTEELKCSLKYWVKIYDMNNVNGRMGYKLKF
jgi:hypothetical protein